MRFILIVLIIAGALGFAWWKGWLGSKHHANTTGTSGFTLASGDAPATHPPIPEGKLSAEDEQLLAATTKAWNALKEAGKDPLHDLQSPVLARDFSKVLRATYAQPGLRALAERLINDHLAALGQALFLSPIRYDNEPTGLITIHQVQPGDKPEKIAKPYGISTEFLNILRGREPNNGSLQEGEAFKVVKLTGRDKLPEEEQGFFLHACKSMYRLDVFVGGVFIKRYPIGIGAPTTPTPVGRARIDKRTAEASWTHPISKTIIQWNDPDNLLGRYWIRLDPTQLKKDGIGIHGYTGKDAAVEVQASNGCLRMLNHDAEQLYHLLSPCGYYKEGFVTRATMIVEIAE